MNKPITLNAQEVADMLKPEETSAWFSATINGERLPHEDMKVLSTHGIEFSLMDETNRAVLTVIDDGAMYDHMVRIIAETIRPLREGVGGPCPEPPERDMLFEKGPLLIMCMLYNHLVGRTLAA